VWNEQAFMTIHHFGYLVLDHFNFVGSMINNTFLSFCFILFLMRGMSGQIWHFATMPGAELCNIKLQ
jgi:hypothetical protein